VRPLREPPHGGPAMNDRGVDFRGTHWLELRQEVATFAEPPPVLAGTGRAHSSTACVPRRSCRDEPDASSVHWQECWRPSHSSPTSSCTRRSSGARRHRFSWVRFPERSLRSSDRSRPRELSTFRGCSSSLPCSCGKCRTFSRSRSSGEASLLALDCSFSLTSPMGSARPGATWCSTPPPSSPFP